MSGNPVRIEQRGLFPAIRRAINELLSRAEAKDASRQVEAMAEDAQTFARDSRNEARLSELEAQWAEERAKWEDCVVDLKAEVRSASSLYVACPICDGRSDGCDYCDGEGRVSRWRATTYEPRN